jgi:hypothetical protein
MTKTNGMKKTEILDEIKIIIPALIQKEHDFRIEYAHNQYTAITTLPRNLFFELEENTLWMTLYTHINWLAHFRFLKRADVDKDIPAWLAETFGWPQEVAKAFWSCGRDPIAHTGNRNQEYSVNFNGIKYYIGLQLDDQDGWHGSNGYFAASPMSKDIGGSPMPARQYIFFYPNVEELIQKLVDDAEAHIKELDYTKIVSLNAVCHASHFIKDDGSLFRMSDLLRVYKYATKV